MTIPIRPGPFQFLAEAGEAAGAIAQAKEQRKHHAEELAYRGVQGILAEVKQGLRPASVLADPEVKKLFKAAGFPAIPDAMVLPQPSEKRQAIESEELGAVKPGTAQARAVAGVPSEEVAAGAEAQAKVKGRKAEAELKAGVPELDAEVEKLSAAAQAAGHEFNASIYKTASAMIGTDPRFKKLAVEAATGVLDYRVRMLMLNRENLSVERQLLANDARLTSELLKDADTYYNKTVTTWESNKQLSGDPETYEASHPHPVQSDVVAEFIKTRTGRTMEQFQTHMQNVWDRVLAPDVTGTRQAHPAGAAPPPDPNAPTPERVISGRIAKADPQAAADALVELISTNDITDLQARAVVQLLKESQPASWFRKFNRAYSDRNVEARR